MTFYINTLGCKVNTYESNVIRELLKEEGYIEVDEDTADIILVNTCTVTNTADNKSLKTIRQAIHKHPKILIVMGCLSQNSLEPLKPLKEISIIVGNRNKTKIPSYIKQFLKTNEQIIDIANLKKQPFETMELQNFNKTRAFVKIQDGCNNYCSYCIIPYTRGNVCSKDPNLVLEEITNLIQKGHKEIVLTGIHTGHYGSELKNYSFASLLKDILKIEGLKRLRISSIEMNEITEEVLQILKENNILVSHFHIPLQSGSNEILKQMNRKYTKEDFIKKINAIRSIRKDISITTDLIVGFPGETEELFLETIETLKQIKFSKIHVFPYSKRKGTKAAERIDQIKEEVKKQRVHEVLNLSKEFEIEYMQSFIGKTIPFLPEVKKDGNFIGHTGNYLNIACTDFCPLNEEVMVTIEKIEYPYCIAKRIND